MEACENLHLEKQHQLKILLKKYKHLSMEHHENSTWNNDPNNLQLLYPNFEPAHALS
jgi:hypothetical protein